MTIDQLIERHVDRTGDCWRWTGAKVYGYGHARFGGRMHRAHRLIYTHVVGPIPPGLTIDHLCAQRDCVNPAHLEPVTMLENIRRATVRNRQRPTCIHGHEFTPENTAVGSRGQRVCRECKRRWNADAKRLMKERAA